ncbi:MAG: hypothetical protein COA42_18105 [Alteromonadaceae bacterium]|nr:MAG: hypothetical protein COA42_18105 [Alteromonadaceae bacterium]
MTFANIQSVLINHKFISASALVLAFSVSASTHANGMEISGSINAGAIIDTSFNGKVNDFNTVVDKMNAMLAEKLAEQVKEMIDTAAK